ncbi:MAG: RluA family pseudouridine synthase [Chlamydiae bacterium]|nr:RluA family pseudouridine synthase [Chlamydiota bacterium]
MESFFVSEKEKDQRLDKYLSKRFPDYTRSYFQNLITRKLVLLNGEVVKKRVEVREGDEIEVEFALTPEIAVEPEDIPLDILYEDDDLIVVNKPCGMVVHPAVGNWTGTFVNALLYHCRLEGEGLRPGIVHRLDKDTSGVMVAAKNSDAHQKLVEQFAERGVEKEYVAIVNGNPGNRLIEGNIGRHRVRRQQMAVVSEGGKHAETLVKTKSHNERRAVVHLFPKTGRTHQLRVHMKSIGCPIVGDPIYGTAGDRLFLYAYRLTFSHPNGGKRVTFEAPLPKEFVL